MGRFVTTIFIANFEHIVCYIHFNQLLLPYPPKFLACWNQELLQLRSEGNTIEFNGRTGWNCWKRTWCWKGSMKKCKKIYEDVYPLPEKLTYPPKNGILKMMIFLFPRWDMLVPWRVCKNHLTFWWSIHKNTCYYLDSDRYITYHFIANMVRRFVQCQMQEFQQGLIWTHKPFVLTGLGTSGPTGLWWFCFRGALGA